MLLFLRNSIKYLLTAYYVLGPKDTVANRIKFCPSGACISVDDKSNN